MYYEGTRDFFAGFMHLGFKEDAAAGLEECQGVLMPKYLPVFNKVSFNLCPYSSVHSSICIQCNTNTNLVQQKFIYFAYRHFYQALVHNIEHSIFV